MTLARTISPDMVGAMLDERRNGTDAWVACVEADFGSRVGADANGEPDTLIAVAGVDVVVQVSLDRGRSWRTVPPAHTDFTQQKIPGLAVGQSTTHLTITLRVFFYRPTSRLVSIRTFVRLENGDVFDHTAANADLESVGPTGVTTRAFHGLTRLAGRIRPVPEAVTRFTGAAHGFREVPTTRSNFGPKVGTRVSIGGYRTESQLVNSTNFERQHPDLDPNHYRRAAMAFEAWVYFAQEPTGEHHTLFSYATNFGRGPGNLSQSNDGAQMWIDREGKLVFQSRNRAINTGGGSGSAPTYIENYGLATPRGTRWARRWRHVMMSYDGLACTLFIDGVARAVKRFSRDGVNVGPIIPTDGSFTLGNRTSNNPLGAVMTEARLWGRERNPQRLLGRRMTVAEAAYYQETQDLAACWPLTSGLNDISPAGVHLESRDGVQHVSATPHLFGLTPPRTRITPGDPPIRVPFWDVFMMSLATDSNTIRICTGASPVVFPTGQEYTPAGTLLSIGDPIRERGVVDPDQGMTFTLTGIDPQLRSVAMNALYADRPIRIYLVTLGEHGGITGMPWLAWEGKMDQLIPIIRSEGEGASARAVMTIGVKAVTYLRDFERPSAYRWNSASHRAVYPDDAGFDEVADVAERQELWPRQADLDQGAPGEDGPGDGPPP